MFTRGYPQSDTFFLNYAHCKIPKAAMGTDYTVLAACPPSTMGYILSGKCLQFAN